VGYFRAISDRPVATNHISLMYKRTVGVVVGETLPLQQLTVSEQVFLLQRNWRTAERWLAEPVTSHVRLADVKT